MAQWPSPNYNRIIETDPQIVKVPGAPGDKFIFGWGSRPSLLSHMNNDPSSEQNKSGQPKAPEMTVKHVNGK